MLERDVSLRPITVVGLSPWPRVTDRRPAVDDTTVTADLPEWYEVFDKVEEILTQANLSASRFRLGRTIERYRHQRYVNIERWHGNHRDSQQWGRVGEDISSGRYFYCFGRLDNGLPDDRKRWLASTADIYSALTALLGDNESLDSDRIETGGPAQDRRQARPKVEGKPARRPGARSKRLWAGHTASRSADQATR